MNPWTTIIYQLEAIASQYSNGEKYDAALINYYRTENDSVQWHNDKDSLFTHIASFSFYPEGHQQNDNRYLQIRRVSDRKSCWLSLDQGSLLIMKPGMQYDHKTNLARFLHQVPKETDARKGRINVTFRQHAKEKDIISGKINPSSSSSSSS